MSSAQASRTSSASAAQTSGAHSAATVGAVTTESSSGFGSNLAQRRSSQALADSVRLLTIDTSPVKYHPPGEAQETNGNEGGEVGGEDEEESVSESNQSPQPTGPIIELLPPNTDDYDFFGSKH